MGLVVVIALLFAWLLTTESGARFVVGQISSRLPAGATIDSVGGSLADQLQLSRVGWRSETLDIDARDIALDIDLMALLRLELHIESLGVGSLEVVQKPDNEPQSQSPDPDVEFALVSPIPVNVAAASFRKLELRTEEQTHSIDIVELAASLRGADLIVEQLRVGSNWLTLSANADVVLQKPYQARLEADWGLTTEQTEFSGRLSLRGDAVSYELGHQLRLPVQITTSGQLRIEPSLQATVLNQWAQLTTTYNENLIQMGEGQLSLDGSLKEFEVTLQTSASLNEHVFEEINFAVQGREDHLQLTTLKLKAQGLTLNAGGDVYLNDDRADMAKLHVNIDSDQLNRWHPDLNGSIALNTKLDANFEGAQLLTLNASIQSLQGQLQGQPLTGSGSVELEDNSWLLRDLKLRAGDNALSASGSLDERLIQSQVSVAAANLGQLWPGIAGSVKGELSVQGSLEKPVSQMQMALREVRAFDAGIESLDLEAELSAEQQIRLQLSALGARVNKQDIESLSLSLQGSKDAHRWEATIRHEAVNVDANAAGQYENSRYELLLESLDAIPADLSAWALVRPAEILIDRSGFSTSNLCLEGTVSQQLCIDTASWSGESWRVQANAEQLPVRPLLKFVPLEIEGTGSLSALVSLQSGADGPQGQFELSLNEAAIWDAAPSEDPVEKLPIGFAAKGEIIGNELISNAQLKTGSSGSAVADLRLGSISSADGAIAMDLKLDFPDLAFIDTLLPNTKLHSGSITGQASLSGLRSRPAGSGSLRLQEASLSLLALGTDWTEVSLGLSPQSPMQWNVDGGFVSGEGRLSIDGQLDLDRDKDQWLQLKVTGEEAKLVQLPDMSLSASPDLNLIMGRTEASLKGKLRIPDGRIAIEELPEGAVESSSDTVIHLDETSRVSATYPLRLDLQLILGPKLQIDAFGLDSGLQGDLTIDGDVGGQLQAFGDLELESGRFEAYGQELDISRGRLSFRGPLENPQLDFRARRQVKIGEVGIEMRGTVNAPESSLYSTPTMPESEVLSWLLTGRGLNESSPENGERLSNAAVALGLSRAGAIVAELGGQLGLDRFEIADDGNGERLLAGKWVSEALYLQYAYGIFDKLGSVLLRYRLSRRFTLESTSGAEQSLDLIYEVGRGN